VTRVTSKCDHNYMRYVETSGLAVPTRGTSDVARRRVATPAAIFLLGANCRRVQYSKSRENSICLALRASTGRPKPAIGLRPGPKFGLSLLTLV